VLRRSEGVHDPTEEEIAAHASRAKLRPPSMKHITVVGQIEINPS
jgi:hypothetical protein